MNSGSIHHVITLTLFTLNVTWYTYVFMKYTYSFLGGSVGEESACNAGDTGDTGFIPGWGRSPGGGHGNLLQYSCLEDPMDRGAWQVTVHGVAKSQTWPKQLSMHAWHRWKEVQLGCKMWRWGPPFHVRPNVLHRFLAWGPNFRSNTGSNPSYH